MLVVRELQYLKDMDPMEATLHLALYQLLQLAVAAAVALVQLFLIEAVKMADQVVADLHMFLSIPVGLV